MALPSMQTVLTRSGSSCLYSTILFPAGTSLSKQDYLLFKYAQGDQVPGYAANTSATFCETNMRGTAGQMPGQQAFLAEGITANFSNYTSHAPVSSVDLHNLIDNGTMLLWYYQDVDTIVIGPLANVPAGAGLQGVAGTNGGIPSEITSSPGMLRFPEPVPINPLQTFAIKIVFPATAVAPVVSTALRLSLWGKYDTAVASG